MSNESEQVKKFLANGGKITKLPYIEPEVQPERIRSSTQQAPTLYDLTEGAFLFGEKITRKRKVQKKKLNIDVSVLPEGIKHLVPSDE